MVMLLAESLQEHFFPYVERVAPTLARYSVSRHAAVIGLS
jgi:hypothetical protein